MINISISVIPHPHYPDVGARYYESARSIIPPATEPPPAHRNPLSATPPVNYAAPGEIPAHLLPKLEREREQREKERKSSIPGLLVQEALRIKSILISMFKQFF